MKYTRKVSLGQYGTICLPRAVTSYNNAVFFQIDHLEQGTQEGDVSMHLKKVKGTLQAGMPYIFCAINDGELSCTLDGDAVTAPLATPHLVGNLTDTSMPVPVGAGILKDGEIRMVREGSNGVTVGPNRAYITL